MLQMKALEHAKAEIINFSSQADASYNNDAARCDELVDVALANEPWAAASSRYRLKDPACMSFDV